MPFKSEKQRRYLWLKHPDIAKRWAKEYPGQKNLPLYAHDKDDKDDTAAKSEEKQSQVEWYQGFAGKKLTSLLSTCFSHTPGFSMKQANSIQRYIDIPHSDEPTYAGEEHAEVADSGKPVQEGGVNESAAEKIEKSPLLQKLSVVLSRPLLQFLEDEKATQQARQAARIPQNANLKQYPVATPTIPPPIGMAQAPAQPTPQAQPPQPAQPAQSRSVGNGAGPTANPINAFGALSSSGQINGNAAFGVKNSPDSLKTAGTAKPDDHLYTEPDYAAQLSPEKHKAFDAFWTDNDGYAKIIAATRKLNKARKPEDVDPREIGAGYTTYDNINRLLQANALPVNEQFTLDDWKRLYSPPVAAKTALDKQAYGGSDEDQEWDRWYDGGAPWADALPKGFHSNPKHVAAMTQAFADAAKRQGAQLQFYSDAYGDQPRMDAAAAIKAILQHKKLDLDTPGLPNYYQMTYPSAPRKGLLQHLRLQSPGTIEEWPEGHPAELAYNQFAPKTKKAAHHSDYLGKITNMDFPMHPDPEDLDLDDEERMKTASANTPCSCGCGDTVKTCKCSSSCSCKKPGGSCYAGEKAASSPAWQRSAGKNPEGGLNAKGRASYKAQTGGTLKAPVTESNPTGERDKRQNSFCSRMCGMKRVNTGADTAKDPDSRINKSLRKWNCKCGSAFEFGKMAAESEPASQPKPKQKPKPKPAVGHPYMLHGGVLAGLILSKALRAGYRAHEDYNDYQSDQQYDQNLYHHSDLPDMNNDIKYAAFEFGQKMASMAPVYGALAGAGLGLLNNAVNIGDVQAVGNYAIGNGNPVSLDPNAFPYHSLEYIGRNMAEGAIMGGAGGVGYDALKLMFGGKPKQPEKEEEKTSANRRLAEIPAGSGPDQIEDAVMRFNQLRALVRPDTETLKGRGLSRGGFQHELRRIATNSQGKDKYNLSRMAPNPGLRAAIAGAAGLAGTGALAYMNGAEGLGAGLAGTGLAAGGAYLHGLHQRNNFRNTSKLLKDYGLLKPELLRQAYPLLADNYRAG